MPKGLCIFGMVTAALLLIIFGLDIAVGFLRIESVIVDVSFLIAAGLLGYMSWTTYREQV